MNKIKNLYENLALKQLIFLLFLGFLLIILSFLEIVSLASIPILLSSILGQKDFNLIYLNFDFTQNYLFNMSQDKQLEFLCTFIVFLFIFKNIFHAFIIFFQGQVVKNIKIYISKQLFNLYLNQDYLSLVKKSSSVILRTLSVDVGNTTIYILNLLNLLKESLILIAIILLLFLSNTEITIFLFLVFSLVTSIFYFVNKKKLFERGKLIQGLSSNVIRIVYEALGLFKELKIYNLNNFIYKNYSKKIKDTEKNVFLNYFIVSLPRLFLELAAVILIVSIIYIQFQKDNNALNILPFLSLVVVSALRMVPLFNVLTNSLANLKSIQPSFDLVFSELNKLKEKRIIIKNKKQEFINLKDKIELNNISFKYKKEGLNIINKLNLKIQKGDKIGLVGESGIGKSTLINIIMGLLKPTEGKIYVNSNELLPEKNQSIANIGYVPQEVFLIEDKLKKNIAIGIKDEEISKEKLLETSKAAQILKFVDNLEKGFDTIVEENGRNFSVGQKQRIGVARALYRDPELLIFDESTSSLDKDTEEKFIQDVFLISKDKTIIFISHKMSALSKCDKIFDIKKNMFIKI